MLRLDHTTRYTTKKKKQINPKLLTAKGEFGLVSKLPT